MNRPNKISIGRPIRLSTATKESLPEPIGMLEEKLTGEEIRSLFYQRAELLKSRDPRYIRAIIIGAKGSGKTYSCIRTLPRPILLLCFDPDAERIVQPEEIDTGEILPILYYGDNPKRPRAYLQYEEDVDTWKENGFFDYFASVVVDGLSTLQQVHLRQIAYEDRLRKMELKKIEPKTKVRFTLMPELRDYHVLKTSSILEFMSLCAVPCHLVLTAHIMEERYTIDSETGAYAIRKILNTTPALQGNIPYLFSEIYLAQRSLRDPKGARSKAGMPTFTWLTERTAAYPELPLMTRFNAQKKIVEMEEPQDFRALLKKTGCLWEDKPFVGKPKEEEK